MNARSKSAALVTAALAAILLPAVGCQKKVAPPPPPPPPAPAPVAPTATLTASPNTITAGQSSVLTWSSTDASSVTIDNGVGTVSASGTQNVTPSTNTTYHLIARGDGGSADATATVTVNQPPPPPPPPAPAMTESIFEQSVKPVFYGFDSYKLSSDAQQILTDSVAFLQAHSDIKVLVAGYCDERGSAEYNLALGQNRANAAKDALVKAGIDPSRLRTISYGKEKPFCSEHNEACWQQNRRAQFSIDQ